MNERELALAAGLLEGEGTVRISKPTPRNWGTLTVSLVNTDKEIVDFFQVRWPGFMKPATGLRPGQRCAWVWVIAAKRAAAFLEHIRPFVLTTRMHRRIEHALYFQRQKRLGRWSRPCGIYVTV